MHPSMKRQLQALKRLTIGIFATGAGLLVLSQVAQAQSTQSGCPETLGDIEWASPNPSNPLTVSQLLSQSPNCQTPVYLGLHRGAFTRSMDLDPSNNPVVPYFGAGAITGQGLASPTVVTSPTGTFPVFPQSILSVAIPAYQSYLASHGGHLPANIDPTGELVVENGVYSAWPAVIELDPRQDSTGTWYLFHGSYTNVDALTPGVDPNSLNQTPIAIGDATLGNDKLLYRGAALLTGYVSSASAPSIDQLATAQQVLDTIMTDTNVNMVLQLHTRTYNDTINFYSWLLNDWASGHTNAQITNVIGKIYFCVDLLRMTPPGQGTTTNDYNNLNYLDSYNTAVLGIYNHAHNENPELPIASLPPLALMVNFYDDTNLNTQTDVNNALAILQSTRNLSDAKYLGLEITDENSPINQQLESLGRLAESQLGMQIGKSAVPPSHYMPVRDTNGNAAIKYGEFLAQDPTTLVNGNNSIVNDTPFQELYAINQPNLVDLNSSLSFQLGVQDTNPNSSMSLYDPTDNNVTSLTEVQPTIILSDLPLIHSSTQNGEVRDIFPGTYTQSACNPGTNVYPGCEDPNTPGQTTYTLCAPEGGTCTFTGDRNVAFGANGSYRTVTATNTIACNNNTPGFSPDPAEGVVKACYISPPISYVNGIYCGDQNGDCVFQGTGSAAIAANGLYYTRLVSVVNGYNCDASTFGWFSDPIPGYTKACFVFNVTPSGPMIGLPGYTWCAPENGFCQFKGPGRIAYGNDNNGQATRAYIQVFNGGTACNNSIFGDPAPGSNKGCFYQTITAESGATGTSAGTSPGGTGGTSTCDIYASGGTPCVAAHSMVRALFGGYSGRLYQVQRASDGQTKDIGTLTTGGYADSGSQDSFCQGTTCAIKIIYDQTSNNNDLPVTGGLSMAVANAIPITLNGNNKVYGLKITSGTGYRNNATRNVATGSAPEGMYMVTSGTYVNGGPSSTNNGCCFDYGNAETDSADDGNGKMDALNFGNFCEYQPCSGNGPWVEADLENGQYMGNGNNPGDQSMPFDFVTAMLKNNGTDTFALKGGNAQTGTLTTDYSGSLPTGHQPSYIPMRKLGAIILGTGGDNSDWDIGAFFEGAMTSGYPTDDAENLVQANIAAAQYAGDSSGGSAGGGGGTGGDANEPPGPYTGPSDPGGPGPQDGFVQPAAEQQNDIMATRPALASFNGSLYVAFEGLNAANDLYIASSPTGNNFPAATRYTNIQSSSAPALAAFNGQLFMAFRGLNADNDFYVTSSTDGITFPTATRYTNIQMGGAPALAEFNDQLCAAFQANDPGHTLHVTCSPDGVTWPTAPQVPNVLIGSDPAMAVFNGVLYVAFRANDSSNNLFVSSSTDGINFTSQYLAGQTMGGYGAPALVVSNNVLYLIYGANDSDNEMLVTATTDGTSWQGPAVYLNDQMSYLGPGAAAFGNGISVGFQSNDSRQVLFVTNKVTEASSYTGPSDPNGPGPQDGFASPATEQANVVMATKPALTAFNGSVYAAFQGLNASNDLYVTSSLTGTNFPAATRYTNLQSSSAPALATFNNQLFMAFRGLNADNDFYVTSSAYGNNFPSATRYTNIQMGGAPALTVFNGQLCASFQAADPGHTLHVTCSSDGVNWPAAWQVPNVQIGSDPAMTVRNGVMYIAFRADDPSNDVWIASSSDGHNFSSKMLGQTMGGSSSPALVVSNCTLYYIYGANDQDNEMLVMASTDGSTWQGPKAYPGVQMGVAGPGAAEFGIGVAVGFQSNDSRNVMFTTTGNSGNGGCPAGSGNGTSLQNNNSSGLPTPYPRLVRLTNGQIIASAGGSIFRSTDGGNTFTFLSSVPTVSGTLQNSETGLWLLPQTVGSLAAGTLLYSGTYNTSAPATPAFALEIYTSTDQGQTWNYLSTPVQGGGVGHGEWEPGFEIANDGALVMFWSDETDNCCSQKLVQMRTYNGTTWQDKTNTVASTIQSDRPGMPVVSKLPSGVFFMSYELCGPAACTVFYRNSTDGWNFGNPSNVGTKVQTASGQYFEHTPTNVWDPSGPLLLIGQVMFESNGSVSSGNGQTIFYNYSSDGSGPWDTMPAPVQVPDASNNPCPNYSSELLPSTDGSTLLELASNFDGYNACRNYYSTSPWP